MERLQATCLPINVHAILSIPLCTTNISDTSSWKFEKNWCFSVRSAWLDEVAGSPSTYRDAASWKLLWKNQVPGKIRMFLWHLAKHSIPIEDVREKRHMSMMSACGLCSADDSWRHSMLGCSMSRCIWAMVDGELAELLFEITEPCAKQ
jgi:hypothetical protein